jgi:HAD superfamily hydrolase (TIGR01509 family)
MQFDAIIFDMDGTLVDSEIIWEAVEGQMFAEWQIDYTAEIREQVIGLRLDEFWAKLVALLDLKHSPQALTQELEARAVQAMAQVQAKPGADAIVQYAIDNNIPHCIASSSSQAIIEAIVQARGWSDLIPKRYSADLVPAGKPAPDVYLYAAEQLGADPARCLAIEDSANGARAAVAAGMTTFAVPDTHTPAAKFADITPYVYPSLHEVLKALKS